MLSGFNLNDMPGEVLLPTSLWFPIVSLGSPWFPMLPLSFPMVVVGSGASFQRIPTVVVEKNMMGTYLENNLDPASYGLENKSSIGETLLVGFQ